MRFNNGASAGFSRPFLQGLEAATPEQSSDIVIEGGVGLLWPQVGDDAAHYVPNMLDGYFGRWIAELSCRPDATARSGVHLPPPR